MRDILTVGGLVQKIEIEFLLDKENSILHDKCSAMRSFSSGTNLPAASCGSLRSLALLATTPAHELPPAMATVPEGATPRVVTCV